MPKVFQLKSSPLFNKDFSAQCLFFSLPEKHSFSAQRLFSLSDNYTKAQLDKAYKQLALHFHPDKNDGSDESVAAFKGVGEAYAFLSFQFLTANERVTARANYENTPFNKLKEINVPSFQTKYQSTANTSTSFAHEPFFSFASASQTGGYGTGQHTNDFYFDQSDFNVNPVPPVDLYAWSYDRIITDIIKNNSRLNEPLRRRIKELMAVNDCMFRFAFGYTNSSSIVIHTEHSIEALNLLRYCHDKADMALLDWVIVHKPSTMVFDWKRMLDQFKYASEEMCLYALSKLPLPNQAMVDKAFYRALENNYLQIIRWFLKYYPSQIKTLLTRKSVETDGDYYKPFGWFLSNHIDRVDYVLSEMPDEVREQYRAGGDIATRLQSFKALTLLREFGYKGKLTFMLLAAIIKPNKELLNAAIKEGARVSLEAVLCLCQTQHFDEPNYLSALFSTLDLSGQEAFDEILKRLKQAYVDEYNEEPRDWEADYNKGSACVVDNVVRLTEQNKTQSMDFAILKALSSSNMAPVKQQALWHAAFQRSLHISYAPYLALAILKEKPALANEPFNGYYPLQRALVLNKKFYDWHEESYNDEESYDHEESYDDVAQKIIECCTAKGLNSALEEDKGFFCDGDTDFFSLSGWTTLHLAVGLSYKTGDYPSRYINHSARQLINKLRNDEQALNQYAYVPNIKHKSIKRGNDYSAPSWCLYNYDVTRQCQLTPLHLAIRAKQYAAIHMADISNVDFTLKAKTWRVDEWRWFGWKSEPYECEMTALELAKYHKSAVGVRAVQLRMLNDYIAEREKESEYTSCFARNIHQFFHIKVAYDQNDKLAAAYALQRLISAPAADASINHMTIYKHPNMSFFFGDELERIDKRHHGALHQGRLGKITALSYVSQSIRPDKSF